MKLFSSHRSIVALAAAGLLSAAAAPAHALLATNAGVPINEKGGLTEVYRLEIPDNSGGWNSAAIPYSINNSATLPSGFTRIAYYLELNNAGGTNLQYAYVSFDVQPTLANANDLGVPANNVTNGSGFQGRLALANMRVFSNASGATNGSFATGGVMEFWPSNYSQGTNGVFDYDDNGFGTGSGHGSMQLHNASLAQTLFAYNAWGTVRDSEMGVGTQVGGSNNPDWTFNTTNNDNFTVQSLQVFVQYIPEPASMALLGLAGMALAARRRRQA